MDQYLPELSVPSQVSDLWRAQHALAYHYAATGLKFTLDGRLVGDIAEALALDHPRGADPAIASQGKLVRNNGH